MNRVLERADAIPLRLVSLPTGTDRFVFVAVDPAELGAIEELRRHWL